MEIQIAVSKIEKYGSADSGDTVEVVERPHGGLSIVMADGQTSGRGAKSISAIVVRKVISLLAEGVRDGAAVRAASDYLFTERNGKVSATLNVLSIDLVTQTLVITRNNPAPLYLAYDNEITIMSENSTPVGLYRNTRPVISQLSLTSGLTAIVFTDGLLDAGSRFGNGIDIKNCLENMLNDGDPDSQIISDGLLMHALKLDRGQPLDDISIIALRVTQRKGDSVRRMSVRLPL